MKILVIGGAGFIGQHLIARLVRAHHHVLVPTRRLAHARELLVYPTVRVQQADVHDDQVLSGLIQGQDAVINLVGVLHSRAGSPFGVDFERAHVTLPRRIAQLCADYGVQRLLHVSALGASVNGSSQYLRSKAAGEAALQAVCASAPGLSVTVFRPSVVFGRGDRFMTLFARLAMFLPVLPIAGSTSRLQPVYVGDVSCALARALQRQESCGQVYELAGPTVYSLGELVSLAAAWSGHPRTIVPLPDWAGRVQAWLFERLPGEPLMSRDNLDSLKTDNVLSSPDAPWILGIVPTPLEQVAPRYLKHGN